MAYIGKRPQDTFPAGNAVTATTISANAVGASEIAANSVTASELATNSIAVTHIPDGLITGTQLANTTIGTDQIVNGAITTAKLGVDSVTGAKIADDAVDSEHLVDGSIDTAHIGNLQVTSAKIAANTIAVGNIADNAVDGTKIAQNSILTRHIDDAQVTVDQLASSAVTTAKINDDAVTAAKLASDAVVTASITDANVTTAKIADSNITTAKIADDAVALSKMAGLARGKIIVGDASGNPVALALGSSGQVLKSDGTDLAFATDSVLTTENVQDIAGAMFSSNTETGIAATYQDSDGTIDLVIGDNAIAASMIAENIITTRELAANTIATGNIADNAVDGTKIAQNSILTRHIDDGQVTTDQLGADAVTGAKIADNAIDSEHYTDGSIDTAHIADDQVTAAKLANTAVTAAAYGSSSAIPVITVDAQGRITAASTAATSSVLTIAADSGSNDTVTVGTDTFTFEGTANEIETTVSNNKINFGLPTNVTIAGNLTVAGTQTTVSSTTITVADPLVALASGNNSADAVDIGLYGLYDTSGSQDLYSGLFRDASDSGKWKLFKDNQAAPTTTVNTSGTGYAVGTLVANLEGNVTGNTSGSSGSTTGNAATATILATARNIGGVSFNGSANIDLPGVNSAGNQATSGLAATATILATARTIGGVSFDGSANINLPGVNAAGSQNTTGSAATLTTARAIALAGNVTGTANFDGSAGISITTALADNTVDSAELVDGSIDTSHIADDQVTLAKMAGLARGKIIYGDSSGNPAALALGSNGQVLKSDGTDIAWAADAGLSTEEVQDIAGGMFTGNTETGITATYQDGDGTIDLVIGANGIVSSMITDDNVTQAKIADDAVGADQLAANSVVSASIVNGSIVSADIAANTIALSNIADNAVDGTKIASNSILTRHIDDNQITGDQIADDIVLSGTGAIRMPDGTTGQRPGSAAAGMFRYNTTDGKFEGYTDSWGEIGGGGSNGFLTDIFDDTTTPATDGSRTAFTMSQSVSSENFVMVFIDGVFQNQAAYSVSGDVLTLADAPVAARTLTVHSVSAAVAGDGLTVDNFSGDGSDTTFTLSLNPTHENNTQVYIDGVYQFKNTYAVSGTTLTFSAAPPNGTAIEVMIHSQTTVNNAASLNAGAISGLTEVTIAGADHVMLFDATDNALKKGLASDLIEQLTTEQVQDVVGAMVSSNTETGVAVTYEDGDGTLDFVLATAQPTVTSLGTLTALTVDDITLNGSTLSTPSSLTLDLGGNLTINVDGTVVSLSDDAVNFGQFYNSSSGQFNIYSPTSNKDIVFRGNDNGSGVNALTLDMSEAGAATFNAGATFGGTVQPSSANGIDLGTNGTEFRTLYLDTSLIASNALSIATGTDLTLDAEGDITLDANGGQIYHKDAGTTIGYFENSSSDWVLRASVQDKDIKFMGNDNGSGITALTLDMSEAGAATFNSQIGVGAAPLQDAKLDLHTAGSTAKPLAIRITNAASTNYAWEIWRDNTNGDLNFGEELNGTDTTRVTFESGGKVGIGTTSPASPLHVAGNMQVNTTVTDSNEARFKVVPGGAGDNCTVQVIQDDASTVGVYLQADGASWFTGGINPGSGDTTAANVLDDYEEGTWNPSFIGTAGSAGSWAESTWTARYTKIGRVVRFHASGYVTNKGSYSGNSRVAGLPYTNAGSTTACTVSLFPEANYPNSKGIVAQVAASSAEVHFFTGARADVAHAWADVGTGYYCNISGHYEVS